MYFLIKKTVFWESKKAPSRNSGSAVVNLGQRAFGLKEWPKTKSQPRIHGGRLAFMLFKVRTQRVVGENQSVEEGMAQIVTKGKLKPDKNSKQKINYPDVSKPEP